MKLGDKIYRTFRLDRLYFRYIQDTELIKFFTAESLAAWLEDEGFIKLSDDKRRYVELDKFTPYLGQSKLVELVKKRREV